MPDEIVLCIDMQKTPYIGDADAACQSIKKFIKAAAARDVPTWLVFFTSAPELQNVILNADTTRQDRERYLRIFEESPGGGGAEISFDHRMQPHRM